MISDRYSKHSISTHSSDQKHDWDVWSWSFDQASMAQTLHVMIVSGPLLKQQEPRRNGHGTGHCCTTQPLFFGIRDAELTVLLPKNEPSDPASLKLGDDHASFPILKPIPMKISWLYGVLSWSTVNPRHPQ